MNLKDTIGFYKIIQDASREEIEEFFKLPLTDVEQKTILPRFIKALKNKFNSELNFDPIIKEHIVKYGEFFYNGISISHPEMSEISEYYLLKANNTVVTLYGIPSKVSPIISSVKEASINFEHISKIPDKSDFVDNREIMAFNRMNKSYDEPERFTQLITYTCDSTFDTTYMYTVYHSDNIVIASDSIFGVMLQNNTGVSIDNIKRECIDNAVFDNVHSFHILDKGEYLRHWYMLTRNMSSVDAMIEASRTDGEFKEFYSIMTTDNPNEAFTMYYDADNNTCVLGSTKDIDGNSKPLAICLRAYAIGEPRIDFYVLDNVKCADNIITVSEGILTKRLLRTFKESITVDEPSMKGAKAADVNTVKAIKNELKVAEDAMKNAKSEEERDIAFNDKYLYAVGKVLHLSMLAGVFVFPVVGMITISSLTLAITYDGLSKAPIRLAKINAVIDEFLLNIKSSAVDVYVAMSNLCKTIKVTISSKVLRKKGEMAIAESLRDIFTLSNKTSLYGENDGGTTVIYIPHDTIERGNGLQWHSRENDPRIKELAKEIEEADAEYFKGMSEKDKHQISILRSYKDECDRLKVAWDKDVNNINAKMEYYKKVHEMSDIYWNSHFESSDRQAHLISTAIGYGVLLSSFILALITNSAGIGVLGLGLYILIALGTAPAASFKYTVDNMLNKFFPKAKMHSEGVRLEYDLICCAYSKTSFMYSEASLQEMFSRVTLALSKLPRKIYETYKEYTGRLKDFIKRFKDARDDAEREEILNREYIPAWSKFITFLMSASVATVLVKFGLIGPIVAIIGVLVFQAIAKWRIREKKKRATAMLANEIAICEEKINDARGDGNKEAKYAMMRTRDTLKSMLANIEVRAS